MNRNAVIGLSVGLFAVAYLGLTWGSGRMTQAQLEAWHEKATAKLPLLKVTDRKVRQGLFSSTEDITYEIDFQPFRRLMKDKAGMHPASDMESPEPFRFTLRNHIQHGPLPGFSGFGMARIDTTVVLSEQMRQELMQNIGTDKPLEVTTLLGFTGGGTSKLKSPAFQYRHVAKDVNFEWRGMESEFNFGRNMDTLEGTAKMPGLRMTETDADGASPKVFDLGEMRMDADLKRAIGELFTGKVSFALAGFSVNESGNANSMAARNVRYDIDMDLADDYLDMIIKMGLEQLSFKETQVSDVHYDLSLRHLHAPTYAEMATRMQELQWKSLGGDPTASVALIGLFAEYGPRLLEHKPELMVDHLGFTLPEGAFKISGKVELPGFAKDDLQAGMPALIGKIDASFDIKMSQGLLDKNWSSSAPVAPEAAALAEGEMPDPETGAPQGAGKPGLAQLQALKAQTQALEEQGFIKRNGDSLESRIEFRNGALTANGKPMGGPPPDAN